ncbi:MAG: hypothetical protein JXR76_15295 [Deltaproteobacteria bacterium]|nr:hypothetical protein [Deltaproteobacteria bacterium]
MTMISYDNVIFPGQFSCVREDSSEYDRWPDYEALLDLMSKEFFTREVRPVSAAKEG